MGPRPAPAEFAMVSLNATAWASALRWLLHAPEAVRAACIQETHVLAADVAEKSAQAHAAGWRTVWNPAQPTAAGRTSGGVAVAVRGAAGLRGGRPGVPGRVLTAVVDLPGDVVIQVGVVYAYVADPEANELLFEEVREVRRASLVEGVPVVVAGD